jgi:uncharacterized membrane protein (UPF0127 family)
MAKNILLIILILITIYVCYLTFFDNPKTENANVTIKNVGFSLEVAKSIPQKTKGLMNRTELCKNCGMIFVSLAETPQIFWMKDTLIPLSMVFLDKNGVVINIEKAYPEDKTLPDSKLKMYRSLRDSKYVIELNVNRPTELGLSPGDIINLPQL